MEQIYINKKIQSYINKLIDLFCLEDNTPIIYLRPKLSNMQGRCRYPTLKENSRIVIGCKNGLRLSTLVHEMIHAMNYRHINNINDYADFNHLHDSKEWRYKNNQRRKTDTYSLLIVKDLTGKKELIL